MVQHYLETVGRKDHLTLESVSDTFTPTDRRTINVLWELSVKAIDGKRCELTNYVRFQRHGGIKGIPRPAGHSA